MTLFKGPTRSRPWQASASAPFGFLSGPRRPSTGGTWRSPRVPPALHTKAQVLELTDGDFVAHDWDRHRIPNSRRWIYLPCSFGNNWDGCVETVALAMAVDDGTYGVGWVRRQEICRSGNVWFLANSKDGDVDVTVIGEFTDAADGRWECLKASDVFVCGPGRIPVAPEAEREPIGWIETPLSELAGDDDDWSRASEQVRSMSVITEHGVELVGTNGSSAMPGPGDWWLLPMSEADAADLSAIGIEVWSVTFQVKGMSTHAVISQLDEDYAMALAQAHGLHELVVLDHDWLRLHCRMWGLMFLPFIFVGVYVYTNSIYFDRCIYNKKFFYGKYTICNVLIVGRDISGVDY